MKAKSACNDAFIACHQVYRAARELLDSRVPTTQLHSASKYLWRPDLRPRLVEFVADFALAGERAFSFFEREKGRDRHGLFAPDNPKSAGQRGSQQFPRASRLILFRIYYLGGAEYHAARRLLGISERTWSDWAEEIRFRVGDELLRARMYPVAKYFRQGSTAPESTAADMAASTNSAGEATMNPVAHEPDFD